MTFLSQNQIAYGIYSYTVRLCTVRVYKYVYNPKGVNLLIVVYHLLHNLNLVKLLNLCKFVEGYTSTVYFTSTMKSSLKLKVRTYQSNMACQAVRESAYGREAATIG